MVLAKQGVPVSLELVKQLVSLLRGVAHSDHLVSLGLVYDVLLGVCCGNDLIFGSEIGSELLLELVLNVAEHEYEILALAGFEGNIEVV